jgi:hypothetical protein
LSCWPPTTPLADAEPYLVLEHVSGCSLEELLDCRYAGGIDEVQAVELLLPVIEAIRRPTGRAIASIHADAMIIPPTP